MLTRIEVNFGLPVDISDEHSQKLVNLIGEICDANEPDGWCFWPSGIGSKPSFSQIDSLFLGKEPDPNAPTSGEPTWDDSIFFIDCCAREAYPDEIERRRLKRERKAQRAAEAKRRWHVRLADWLHQSGWKRASWFVADCYFFCHRNFGGGRHVN